ncbi:farnesyl pyrophosphate synthetase [Mycena floridula]|nr:farnesyl pyrophosphate synthetase [Mycena floridula]
MDEEYLQAAVLGCCVERLYYRRGQPKVGPIAINDSLLLESTLYQYIDLFDLFHETTYQTELGQLLDLITDPEDSLDLHKSSLEKHQLIVIYETAFYSFYFPVAMYMCEIPTSYHIAGLKIDPYATARSILIPTGEYFRIQDFLDFSSTPDSCHFCYKDG